MSNNIITGDRITFANSHSNSDIVLQHNAKGYELIFNSEVKFRMSTTHAKVSIGDYDITLSDDRTGLVFSKGGSVKMILD